MSLASRPVISSLTGFARSILPAPRAASFVAAIALPLAAHSAARASATDWYIQDSSLFQNLGGQSGGIVEFAGPFPWVSVGQRAVKLSGEATVVGEQLQSDLIYLEILGNVFSQPLQVGEGVHTSVRFNLTATGGDVRVMSMFTQYFYQSAPGSLTGGLTFPTGLVPEGPTGLVNQSFDTDAAQFEQQFSSWRFIMAIRWTGDFGFSDSLSLSIPSDSIDFSAAIVPAPGAVGAMIVGGLLAARRRRV